MIVQSLQINEDLQLTLFDAEQAIEVLKNRDARVWVDIQEFDSSELETWLDKLNITGLSQQLCLEARDRAGFYPLKKEILLVIPVLSGSETHVEMDFLAILCRDNLLFTIHQKPVLLLQQTDIFEGAEDWLPDASIAGLLSSILIDLSQACLQSTSVLRNSIIAMQERMDRDPEMIEADEIFDKQSDVVALSTVVSDLLPAVEALSLSDKPFFNLKNSREYLNCALVNLQAAGGSLSRLFDSVANLRSGFQMHAQDKTNRRLNMLTILSAIFMPMTFLAGIWGMNFELMPELKLVFGYPLGLVLMALIGSGMFFYFRKAGWFD